MPERDELDQQLVRALQAQPRLTNRALANMVGVSTTTVAARLERLRTDHCLALSVVCDWTRAGYTVTAVVLVRASSDPRDVGRRLAQLQRVHTVNLLLGAYDVFALVLGEDLADAVSAIDELRSIGGVEAIEVQIVHDIPKMTLSLAPLPLAPWDPDELDASTVQLDTLDRQIISAFAADGHQSNREVARRLEVNETTVRSRVGRLESSGLIRLVAVADPVNMGYSAMTAMLAVRYAAGSKVHRRAPGDETREVAAVLECVGHYDAIVVATAADNEALLDLIETIRSRCQATDVTALTVTHTIKHRAHLVRFDAP